VYIAGHAANDSDPVLSAVPRDRRATLMAAPAADAAGAEERHPVWEFVIRMQGEHETVFFDL
jgi:protocatechuate 3,4-dioxygenase alpha subunit